MAKKKAVGRVPRQNQKDGADDGLPVINPNAPVHVYGNPVHRKSTGKEVFRVCTTNDRGYPTPKDRSPTEIVLDRSEGFVPLWGENVTLHWKLNKASFAISSIPGVETKVEDLLAKAIAAWGSAAPVKFKRSGQFDVADFEIVLQASDNCSVYGCTLARAFFPDPGRHDLAIYPILFEQSQDEQVETLIHEIGHVFGLRHFFAEVKEAAFPSVVFGTHSPFTIMNYGAKSVLTEADKSDLANLYSMVWRGELADLNGTPIVQMRPYHELGNAAATAPTAKYHAASTSATGSCPMADYLRSLATPPLYGHR